MALLLTFALLIPTVAYAAEQTGNTDITLEVKGDNNGDDNGGSGGDNGGSGGDDNDDNGGGDNGGGSGGDNGGGGNNGGNNGGGGGSSGGGGGGGGGGPKPTPTPTPAPVPNGDKTPGTDPSGDNYVLVEGVHINNSAIANGYINGYPDKTFKTSNKLTRSEFAAILYRVFDFDNKTITKTFTDTKGIWAEKEIGVLASNKVILGIGNGLFDPTGVLTRDQAIQMLARVVDFSKYDSNTTIHSLDKHYAKNMVARAINAGIVGKVDDNYDVGAHITRGEMVSIINNVIYKQGVLANKNNIFTDVNDKTDFYEDILKSINGEGKQ